MPITCSFLNGANSPDSCKNHTNAADREYMLQVNLVLRSIRFQTRALSWIKRQRVKESEQLLRMRER